MTHARNRLAFMAPLLAAVLLVGLVAVPPASAQDTGGDPPEGDVSADLVTVHDTTLAEELDVVDLEVGRARGEVGSELSQDFEDQLVEATPPDGDVEAGALANNLDARLLDELNLSELLVHAEQVSPPDQDTADSDELLESLPDNPLLDARIARASARALTGDGSGCPGFAEGYSEANADLAGAEVLPGAIDDQTPLLALTGRDDDDVVSSNGVIDLVDDPALVGDAVRSTATADLAAVELAEYQIAVVSQPRLSVTSPGPGDGFTDAQAAMDAGALEWEAPVLEIRDPDGQELATIGAGEVDDSFEIPGVATISVGDVQLTSNGSDGTLAAEGELARIDVADDLAQVAHSDVAVAPLSASATTPENGVDCPDPMDDVTKDISQDPVAPGDTFTYTITIPNDDPWCTLTDVTVVDQIGGVDGLEITDTDPAADDIDGTTVTWNDVGPIEPGEDVTLTVDVAVPDDAEGGTITESLAIDALCDDEPTDFEEEFPGPGIDPDAEPAEPPVDRVDGPTRVDTGVEVSEDAFETATAAVLARSDDFPDALTASSLAAEIPGPILVNPPSALNDDVGDELERLEVEQVYLAGGTGALSEQVEQDVQDRGIDTVRLDGNTRYHTAELIAREVADLGGPVDSVVLARDDLFPDSLSAGNLATWGRAPILLTQPDRLHGNSEETMTDSSVVEGDGAFVVGGTAAVGTGAVADARNAGFGVERLAGPERYATSVAISERVVDSTDATVDPLYLATGRDFSDALVAAPAAFFTGGSLTLVDGVDLDISHASRDYLTDRRDAIGDVKLVGGTAAISTSVEDQILTALGRD